MSEVVVVPVEHPLIFAGAPPRTETVYDLSTDSKRELQCIGYDVRLYTKRPTHCEVVARELIDGRLWVVASPHYELQQVADSTGEKQ